MKRKAIIQGIMAGVVIALSVHCSKPYNLDITNHYFNFYVRVDVETKQGVNDFHVILSGVDTFDVKLNYFTMAPEHPVSPQPKQEFFFKVPMDNASLMLWEFNPPLQESSLWNFGLSHTLMVQRVRPIVAYWTYHGAKSAPVAILPFPLLEWQESADTVIAIINNSATSRDSLHPALGLSGARDTREDVLVDRSWAYSEHSIDMYNLMWEHEKLKALEWHKVEGDPITVAKGSTASYRFTDYDPDDYRSIIVKYTVTRKGDKEPLYYFIDQAEVNKVERPRQ
ncbi:hypothetical protein JXM67_08205 [candidate division WOR-3 bacterium]|nr:hypothetical protein [candidate division WOR-3 bacterium]